MSTKTFIWIFLSIGSVIGGWLPTVFGADWLSMWSFVGSAIGSFAGIYAGFQIGKMVNGE